MNFNLCQILGGPQSVIHTLHGFDEVVESVRWGLSEIGHNVTVSADGVQGNATNIIFGLLGTEMFPIEHIRALPANTIVYNHEQIASASIEKLPPVFQAVAERFRIWDYHAPNFATWKKLNPLHEPVHVPVGWSPTLRRVPRAEVQEIDVLIYGLEGQARINAFWQLCRNWVKTIYVCGLYGKSRDELIAKSKIILNINNIPGTRVFEAVRVFYLLGNGKAVISDSHPEYQIDTDLRAAVMFVSQEKIVESCINLLQNNAERRRLESAGPIAMEARDIRPILRQALLASGIQ